ncbi:hypothetical protein GCM10022289_33790 [Pedobacter jeongneungensis]|uniref:Cytochrome c domain-containing protein n=1 Tax=Pedobacter jeongneungensis TaxID=947309 RepID=A0ABP8BKK4_9SPHI
MVSNIIKLSLGSILLVYFSCQNADNNKINVKVSPIDACKYYRYDAGQTISNLGCKNCHLLSDMEIKDDRGWATFGGLAKMDSLKLIDYVFKKKHKGWYSKNGTFKTARMDTLTDCEIKSVIRYIKDYGRDIVLYNP